MVRIRLRRMGFRHKPSYRVVVADARAPRDGKFIETIGHYNPQSQPKILEIKGDRARYWLGVGAQPSDTVMRLFKNQGIVDAEGKVTAAAVEVVEEAKPAKAPRKAKVAAPATEAAPAAEAAPVAEALEPSQFGEGSVRALADNSTPEGYPIKGNANSMLYHVPGSRYYDATVAEVWFASEEAAEKAGFRAPGSPKE